MKTKWIAALIITGFFISSCKKENNPNPDNTGAISGTWRVTLYTDSDNDETADFADYTFSFNDNGVLAATISGTTSNGKWSKSSSKFNIDLGPKSDGNKPLGELSDDWHIISITNSEIKLGDDNESSGELLTFTKN